MDVEALFYIVRADLKGKPVKRQREVAKECDLAWSTVRKIIDGSSNVNVATLQKLHRHYFPPHQVEQRDQQAA